MPFTVKMPKLSPTMEEGTIAKWHVSSGDHVEDGDLLFEVATDKATVEYNALDEGYLRKILVEEGDLAEVNQPVAIFTEEKDESIEGYEPEEEEGEKEQEEPEEKEEEESEEKKEKAAPKKEKKRAMEQPKFVPAPPLEDYRFPYRADAPLERVLASPLARKLAKERGVNLSAIKGTGPSGRIMSRDLETAPQGEAFSLGTREIPTTPPGTYEEIPMTQIRKAIGRRLQEAKSFIPHYYVRQSIDADQLIHLRTQLKEGGMKLTYNDFVMKASAMALRKHPVVNSGYDSENQAIIRFETIDISVAVSIDDGLITPIVRHTDFKSLTEISAEVKALAKKAHEGKLAPDEYEGGSFTVSNLGMYGVTDFQAIINPPQAAILAVSGISHVPVVKNGQVVPGNILNATLSSDHRIVDGAEAAKYLQTLKHYLENPFLLLTN